MSQSALPMLGARRDQMFPTMTQEDIDRLRRFGESKFYETGERIVRAGHVAPGLIVILSDNYNRQRLHSALGYITPEQAERHAA